MKYPNFNEEKKLWRKGYKYVVGLDEAGRGPLSGPVVAAAVVIKNFQFSISNFQSNSNFQLSNIKDSKKLSAKKREEIFEILKEMPEIEWGVGRVSERVIDRINILEATKLAMRRAVNNIKNQKSKIKITNQNVKSNFLIIDGNFKIPLSIPQKSIIKADEKVFSCACASIIAKVTRDRMMVNYHKKYPQYSFAQHKGYPTKLHRKMLKKHGSCKIHRKTFRLV